MGACGSSQLSQAQKDELARSKAIDQASRENYELSEQEVKLLLLGAGESGKSTIFKQMKVLHGTPFSHDEKMNWKPIIYNNVLLGMQTVIKDGLWGLEIPDVDPQTQDLASQLMEVDEDQPLYDVGSLIKQLWESPAIKAAFERRAEFQLFDGAEYFFNAVDRLSSPDYMPNKDDILRSRVRTSGIVEEKYTIDGVQFVMYDVGGQRNERKKWIHCFDSVTAVIFVAALSGYNTMCYEDHTQNRMIEALVLFEDISNSVWFEEASVILFLNKCDLFEKKIATIDIKQPSEELFMDYNGGCDYDNGLEYITKCFLKQRQSGGDEQSKIFTHATCATNTENVKAVFNDSKESILEKNIARGSGWMD
jgi:GTPase SAR1 family protein